MADIQEMPHSNEAERALLGSMILDRSILQKDLSVTEDAFYFERHRFIFRALRNLYDRDEATDYVSIIRELEKLDSLEIVTKPYLLEIANYVPSAANHEHYARIVSEKARYRSLILTCNTIIKKAYDQTDDPDELTDFAESSIFALGSRMEKRGYTHIEPVVIRSMEHLEQLHTRNEDITGVDTGYKRLNEMTSGWQNSDLIIIAGRPSMGKTAFVLNLARNAARRFHERWKAEPEEHRGMLPSVGFFSLEMGADQLVNRLISTEAMIDLSKLRTGRLYEDDWPKLSNILGTLAALPIYIDDSPGLKIMELRAKARRLKTERNIQLMIIDYLQLMEGDNRENRQQEISQISRQLKLLAKELNIPVIALSQLSRALEARNDKRPQLSDLRESGSIEQDADVVGFIHRPEYYKINTFEDGKPTEGMGEFIIGKQRNGPTGDVRLTFLKEYGKFAEPDLMHTDEPVSYRSNDDVGF